MKLLKKDLKSVNQCCAILEYGLSDSPNLAKQDAINRIISIINH